MSWQSDRTAILDAIAAMTPDEVRAFARDVALENQRKSYLLAKMTACTGETFGLMEWAKLDTGFLLTACASGDEAALAQTLLDGIARLYGGAPTGAVQRVGVGAITGPEVPAMSLRTLGLRRVGTVVEVGDVDGHPTVAIDLGDPTPIAVRVSRDEARAWAAALGDDARVVLFVQRAVAEEPEAAPAAKGGA